MVFVCLRVWRIKSHFYKKHFLPSRKWSLTPNKLFTVNYNLLYWKFCKFHVWHLSSLIYINRLWVHFFNVIEFHNFFWMMKDFDIISWIYSKSIKSSYWKKFYIILYTSHFFQQQNTFTLINDGKLITYHFWFRYSDL